MRTFYLNSLAAILLWRKMQHEPFYLIFNAILLWRRMQHEPNLCDLFSSYFAVEEDAT